MGKGERSPTVVVCDAGPLIHLDELGSLDLLSDFARVYVPNTVWMAARNLRIETHGTIGILIRSIRRKQRTKEEVLSVLKSLPERSTLHLKRNLLEQVISMVEGDS